MTTFPHKRFKALLTIQLSLILLLFVLMLFGAVVGKQSITSFDLLMLGVVFLFIVVHLGNIIYNFKLLKVYNDEYGTATFNRSFSIVLLIFYILGCAASVFTLISSLYEALTVEGNTDLLNKSFYLMLIYVFLLAFSGIWISIFQIKLLRLLKSRQLGKAEALLAQLGTDADDRGLARVDR